jgi:class 3 adenylate cyclase
LVDYQIVDSSRALPTGIVTFLLTDIEGSTRLWESEPAAMDQALARHDAIVTAGVQRMNGHVVKSKGEGDSVFAVFRHARDAVTAALVLQCALAAEQWATSAPLRVRMAIHTGQVELRAGDYYGPTVNRCARLRAMARGGQVLLSGVTTKLLQDQLPPGASLKDLGTHQLKDLNAPERVWQLAHPKLPSDAVTGVPDAETSDPLAVTHRAFKLTDHLNHSPDGREWREGKKYTATGISEEAEDGSIRCYVTPTSAALLNALYENYRLPRLWEVTVDRDPTPGSAIVNCREVTALRQVGLPTPTGRQHAHFAVLCAQAAYDGGQYQTEFDDWAAGWLCGSDASGIEARALADSLANEAHRGTFMALPEVLMLANAARAAAHASKLSFLQGRARDEENSQAIAYAAEAVRIAVKLTRIDVVALADQAVPKVTVAPITPLRTAVSIGPNRILRALPT